MAHLHKQADALLKRVRRIAGQVEALERALVAGKDCNETLHLVAAARGAMSGLMDEIVAEHVREHVAHPALTDRQRAQGADELIAAVRSYTK